MRNFLTFVSNEEYEMSDAIKVAVGLCIIIVLFVVYLAAVTTNMETGPPVIRVEDSTSDSKAPAPDGGSGGCVPVCLNVLGVLGILIIRLVRC